MIVDRFDISLTEILEQAEEYQAAKNIKKQPPRPGLVPQTGDPQHPGHWVRPETGKESTTSQSVLAEEVTRLTPKYRDNYQGLLYNPGAELGMKREELSEAWGYARDFYENMQTASLARLTEDFESKGDPEYLQRADWVMSHMTQRKEPLYRGVRLYEKDIAAYKPGETMVIPLSSFSTDKKVASFYARGDFEVEELHPVVFEMAPGAFSYRLGPGGPDPNEHISAGHFTIDRVQKRGKTTVIRISANSGQGGVQKALVLKVNKQGPPGPPPAPGLVWKPETHRWIRPEEREGTGEKPKAMVVRGARIPPNWTDVQVSGDPKSALIATGFDVKGRKQYLYSAEHSAKAASAKFGRLKQFDKALPRLRQLLKKDLGTDVAADVIYLIDKTAFRIGSDREMLAEKKAYGASTLQVGHVKVRGNVVSFDFIGKKGVTIQKEVKDSGLAEMMVQRLQGKKRGDKVFDVTNSQIRSYMNKATGKPFKVKDFRTWHGTMIAQRLVNELPVPPTRAAAERARKEVATRVSEFLGNTPAVSLGSYIQPEVFAPWEALQMAKADGAGKFNIFVDIGYDQEVEWTEETTDDDPDE